MTSRTSTYSAVALALGTSVALTGCLAPVAPENTTSAPTTSAPTADASADCTPETATIFWDKATDVGTVNVGAYLLPGTEAEEGAVPELIESEPQTAVTGDGLNMLTDFDLDLRNEWEAALLEDARRTGQVDRDFGEPISLPAVPDSTITSDAPGTGVQVLSRTQVSMPFEIQCAGIDPVEGFVISAANSSLGNTFFLCGDAGLELGTVESEYAKELCLRA